MLWNLIYSSEVYHPIATKLGEHDLKTLGTQNCQDIFDISNGLPVARRWIYGEKWETGSVLITSTYIVWFWSNFRVLFVVWCRAHRLWLLGVKVIAPPTGSRKCVIFKMLWIQHLIFNRFASNFIRIMSTHGRCETVKGILISIILLPWQRFKVENLFLVIFKQITCLECHETQHTYEY